MKKNSGFGFMGLGVVFVVFTAIVMILFEKDTTFWVSYGIVALFFCMYALTLYTRAAKSGSNTFLGLSILIVGTWWVLIQMLASVVFMIIPSMPVKTVIIEGIILFAVYLILYLSSLFSQRIIETDETRQKEKVAFIRALVIRLEGCLDRCNSVAARTEVTKLLEKVRYCDPMSDTRLSVLEQEISSKIDALSAGLEKTSDEEIGSMCQSIRLLVDERARMCMLYK